MFSNDSSVNIFSFLIFFFNISFSLPKGKNINKTLHDELLKPPRKELKYQLKYASSFSQFHSDTDSLQEGALKC